MKFLKRLFYSVLVLIALLLIVALFLPSTYSVTRTITIDRPVGDVFNQVADFTNWDHWSPWKEMDKDATYTYSSPSSGVGAKMEWKGDTVGTGNITIVELATPHRIKNRLVFLENGNEMVSDDIWTFDEKSGGTSVTWTEAGHVDYPFGRYFGLMMDGMFGGDMEKGLKRLKSYTESMPAPAARDTSSGPGAMKM